MTPTDGARALDALKSFRELHRQCSRMLGTADDLAASRGWVGSSGNQALIQTTYAIDKPDQWTPDFLFRYYRVPGEPRLALFLSILLLPRDRAHEEHFDEPLLSVGWARFATEPQEPYVKETWMARAAFWTPEARNGTFATWGTSDEFAHRAPERRVTSWPLWSIQNAEILGERFDALAVHARVSQGVGPR
jgi:hypothetical protein